MSRRLKQLDGTCEGHLFRQIRLEKGITQGHIAKALRLKTSRYLCELENGRVEIGVIRKRLWCQALGIDVSVIENANLLPCKNITRSIEQSQEPHEEKTQTHN